jgi:hypothetical protein
MSLESSAGPGLGLGLVWRADEVAFAVLFGGALGWRFLTGVSVGVKKINF